MGSHRLSVGRVKGKLFFVCSCGHTLGFLSKEQAQSAHDEHVVREGTFQLAEMWAAR